MHLDIYQLETAKIASEQSAILDEARQKLIDDILLSRLESNGVLHALQLLIENSIGKAKQILKAKGEPVPMSGYDTFAALASAQKISVSDLKTWNAVIGLRNRIVHEYMNVDMTLVLDLVRDEKMAFVVEFLLAPIDVE